ncbi:MAG: NYN domain-containing protein [Candidatus Kariarchaeaceae archaeon]|jgi:uncharacterized LabA/DUF88 family protein
MEVEEEQYFKFKEMTNTILFVDGNYMINISRAMSLKIDMEKLFDHLTKGMFRFRTYWYSALESNLDRSNNAYRFLDRLRYIPRTKVYAGRFSKKSIGHYETALRTDAGVALSVTMVEQVLNTKADYVLLIAGDPEYIPAIRSVQRNGAIVRLIYPDEFGDLRPHPELIKLVDERVAMDAEFLQQFEYVQQYEYEEEKEYDLEYLDTVDEGPLESEGMEKQEETLEEDIEEIKE